MGEIACVCQTPVDLLQESVEPPVGVGEAGDRQRYALASEARRGQGDGKALRRLSARSEIVEPAVDQGTSRQTEGREAGITEPCPNPAAGRRTSGDGLASGGGQAPGPLPPPFSPVPLELCSDLVG